MVKLRILAIAVVLMGALNTTAGIFDMDGIKELGKRTNNVVSTMLYVLIGASVLYILFDRDTYLPFLGKTVFPCSLLKPHAPKDANFSINVKVKPNRKVVYWAAEPSDSDKRKPKDAYKGYMNSGIAVANKKGIATLHLKKPTGYKIPVGKLSAHVHYRKCSDNYKLGKVKTVFL